MKVNAGRETGYGAGVLFFAKDTGRCLLLKRSANGDHAGTWCCPGGGVEDYETIEQAVRRECREEIGYDQPYQLLHMHRDDQGGFIFHNHLAYVPTEFTPTLNDEHTDYAWVDQTPDMLHPGLSRSISEFLRRVNLSGAQGVSL